MPPFCLPKPLTGHSLTLSAYQGVPRWLGVQLPLGFQRPQPLASRPHQLARTAGEIGGVSLNGPPSLGHMGEYAVPMDLPGTGHSERGVGPYLEFLRTGVKPVPDRVHLDLVPDPGDDKAAEVARLRALGATDLDLGQGDVPWTCLADPEGHEFCVLARS